jgi:uncharacterized alkaline shock family protein YloU
MGNEPDPSGVASPRLGRVMIAPAVLTQIVERTSLGVPGVAAMCPRHPRFDRLRGRGGRAGDSLGGVRLSVEENTVSADVAIVARADANMLELGRRIQREVGDAIRQMVGMEVGEINVYVDDVRR